MASKNNIADLNKGEKLDSKNYNIWRTKLYYVLEKQDVLEAINHAMTDPDEKNSAQNRKDQEAYCAWKAKDTTACGILISTMVDDLVNECKLFFNTHKMWVHLKENFGGTTVTRLRQLTIKFDTYKKCPNHTINEHLNKMFKMIRELKAAGHIFTDEQQVQTVIRSLSNS
uniref:Uncharacterized protein LOC105033512 n=1 Tax=Elaeis guineensis var. tenera TaxID=51953 RepID=A0A6I9QC98_ELAGV|nr:uncharacterized protein LOC105033512 [Elaeis guineensis]